MRWSRPSARLLRAGLNTSGFQSVCRWYQICRLPVRGRKGGGGETPGFKINLQPRHDDAVDFGLATQTLKLNM